MESIEVAIIGAGVMGAATAWALSKRGVDAIVLEQFEPGHIRGSSHGGTRVFRFAYPSPSYVRMARQSLPLWQELERISQHPLLTRTGGIDFGSEQFLTEEQSALTSCGAECERLDAACLHERFPMIEYGSEHALYSPDTGVLDAAQCVKDLLDASRIPIRSSFKVEAIETRQDRTIINGSIKAGHVILTAGGWTGPMLARASIDLPLHVTQEQVFHFRTDEPPPVVIDRLGTMRYVVPTPHGIKAGEHGTGAKTTADDRTFEVEPEGQRRVQAWVRTAFPSSDHEPIATETCLYTLTPDEDFIIETRGSLTYASPCSGHGFKFAPLIGETLAALALAEDPPFDVTAFSPRRFAPA